jgi:MORN repeat
MSINNSHFINDARLFVQEKVLHSFAIKKNKIIVIASIAIGFFVACYLANRYFCKVKLLTAERKISFLSRKIGVEEIQNRQIINGQGRMVLPDGIIEEGEFKNGRLNGRGKRTYLNGQIEDGLFVNGTFIG